MKKPKVIVFASQKGGSSKSMLCRCQSVAAELEHPGTVALIDADPQGTTAKWWDRRPEGEGPILLQLTWQKRAGLPPKLDETSLDAALAAAAEEGIEYVFIDTQGALSETLPTVGARADFILIPVKASPDDIDAIPDTLALVEPLGRPFAFMLTQVKAQALITGEARINVAGFGMMCPVVMADRVDYPGAVIDGRTVLETYPSSRSSGEMLELWDFLKEKLKPTTGKAKARAA